MDIKNKRGVWPLGFLIPAVITFTMIGVGTIKTAVDGTLVNNAKVISCKMANNDAGECNEKYGYTPKMEAPESTSGGGLRARILEMQE